MGRLRAIPLMMSLCLLTACGGSGGGRSDGETLALEIQREFAAMTACSARVELEADYETRVFTCVLDAAYDRDTGGSLTVVEPELVRGVGIRFSPEGTELTYGGFSLETGDLTGEGLSPAEVVPVLYRAVARGFAAAVRLEGETLTVTYRAGDRAPGEGLEAVVTFDAADHAPLSGELYWDGTRVATARITQFQREGPEPER